MPIEIIKSGTEFKPHIAVTHMSPEINGGCATGNDVPLVLKAKLGGENLTKVLKALGSNSNILEKASYRNTQSMLEAALESKIRASNPTKDYIYVYVEDFDESTVVFEYSNIYYSIGYTASTTGIVELIGEMQEAVAHRVYTTVDGSSLILKDANEADIEDKNENLEADSGSEVKKESGSEVASTVDMASGQNDNQQEENKMSDKNEKINPEELVKSAVAAAKLQWEADAAEATLVKSTTEIVKGYAFVEAADVSVIVKCLVKDSGAEVILKALDSANAKVEAVEAEMIVIKEKFASTEQVADESTPKVEKQTNAEILKANVAKMKATKNAASK